MPDTITDADVFVDHRTVTIGIEDSRGYHVLTATGTSGTVYVATRTASEGFKVAGYAASYGELPEGEWTHEGLPTRSPIAVSWGSSKDAREAFETMERVARAHAQGTLLVDQPYTDDLTADEWEILRNRVIYGEDGRATVLSVSDGCAHYVIPGTEYTELDGSTVTVAYPPLAVNYLHAVAGEAFRAQSEDPGMPDADAIGVAFGVTPLGQYVDGTTGPNPTEWNIVRGTLAMMRSMGAPSRVPVSCTRILAESTPYPII